MKNSRLFAMETLLAWEKSLEPLDQVLESGAAEKGFIDPRDRQLVMAMVYGVVRWQGHLDATISGSSTHPLKKMKPLTLAGLRVGVYQLLFMDRIPESAAINETVQALKLAGQPKWLSGFVNGLLRTIAREKASLAAPDDAAAVLSHPKWLVERWRKQFGTERTVRICAANNLLPPLVLRINTARVPLKEYLRLLRDNGIECERGRFAQEAVRLPVFRGSVADLPGYGDGFFQVQDEAAQLVCHLLAPFAYGSYLDACAGLGGKALHLAQLLSKNARLVAIEPSEKRRVLLQDNFCRLGYKASELYPGTLQQYAQQCQERFKGILVDAPCSGLGVVRRQPDIRWSSSVEGLQRNQARQLELLATAAGLLEKEGVLVYATCSTDPLENDEVISAFMQEHPEFLLTPARDYLPHAAHSLVDSAGYLRTTPEQGLDGFFAARMIRKG